MIVDNLLKLICSVPLWPNKGMAEFDHKLVMHKVYFEKQHLVITWYELVRVFNFRSFTGLRTRWARKTGAASQISSPCRLRNGWQPSTGCNCSHSSVPHHWGQFPLRYHLLL